MLQVKNILMALKIAKLISKEKGFLLTKNPANSEEMLKLVGMGEKINSYPSQLSGGQQQRVSIARALIKKPISI